MKVVETTVYPYCEEVPGPIEEVAGLVLGALCMARFPAFFAFIVYCIADRA